MYNKYSNMGASFQNYQKNQSNATRVLKMNMNQQLVGEMLPGLAYLKNSPKIKKLKLKRILILCLRIKYIHFNKNQIRS